MKQRGKLGEGHAVPVLASTQWTDAQEADTDLYDGIEVVQWHNLGGSFKAGQRVAVADFKPRLSMGPSSTFTVYRPGTLDLAVGDTVRVTANGWTAAGSTA